MPIRTTPLSQTPTSLCFSYFFTCSLYFLPPCSSFSRFPFLSQGQSLSHIHTHTHTEIQTYTDVDISVSIDISYSREKQMLNKSPFYSKEYRKGTCEYIQTDATVWKASRWLGWSCLTYDMERYSSVLIEQYWITCQINPRTQIIYFPGSCSVQPRVSGKV